MAIFLAVPLIHPLKITSAYEVNILWSARMYGNIIMLVTVVRLNRCPYVSKGILDAPTILAHFESNLSSYYSSYVIDAHARLHPND